MTTSSRKPSGILPVRLGIEPDNKTALSELVMDESLANSMTDRQLDELIIETARHQYTPEYINLTKYFYLKM